MGADWRGTVAVSALIALAAAWLVTAFVRRHAARFGLIDAPNQRSSHVWPTPRGGGIGIVAGSLAAAIWLAVRGHTDPMLTRLIGLSLVIAVVGLRDDIRPLPAVLRFSVQVVICALMVAWRPVVAIDWALVGVGVWWINAFNFMDGIDGIAGVQAVFMLSAAGALAAMNTPEIEAAAPWVWTIAVAAASLGFLAYNWPPARIFMGDVGSTWLPFVMFGLALLTVRAGSLTWPVWAVLGAIFLGDATVTLLRRIVSGQRWFQAHRSHAYQKLALNWRSHRAVTVLVLSVDVLGLLPLATVAARTPAWGWACVAAAYIPLICIMVAVRAGVPDTISSSGHAG